MSYTDPYAQHGQYGHQQSYRDDAFNPYEVQQHGATNGYEQRGYNQNEYDGAYTDEVAGQHKERQRSTFEDDPLPRPMREKTPSNMRRWRTEYQGKIWTKGSRAGCIGRFFCCTLLLFLFFLISIVLSLALWLRPPNIIVGTPSVDLNSFSVNDSTLSIALPVDISVNNPNYFTITLYSLDASVVYPINNTDIGSGHMTNIDFKDHTQTNFTFPVTIDYDAKADPDGAIITDLAQHCGLDTSVAASDISVSVSIKVGIKVMLVPFSTTISQNVKFSCPSGVQTAFESLLKALGKNVDTISSLL
ncbi:uncharacterized protein BXZ73DRAFT_72977 [Epithele typhae]|uniref:uncharacterized protein n=1 Tax=Epithele typhae TaxID=378194 RepID=UPI002007A0DB|nr:uncharacterized protein BXZ73DRAFT_72977 [Epithele typhae]KAH9946141.1 hypothetical protein BXZ73DRAFT_72977 [Epithele typhae]